MRLVCSILLLLAAVTVVVQCAQPFKDDGFQSFRRQVLEGNGTDGNDTMMYDPMDPMDPMTNETDDSPKKSDDSEWDPSWEELLVFGLINLVVIIFGAVFGFFGYRFFKKLVAVFGAIVGFLVGDALTRYLLEDVFGQTNTSWVPWVALGVGVVLLIVGAVVAFRFYIVSIFLVGGFTGVLVGFAVWIIVWASFMSSPWLDLVGWATIVVLFIIGGLLAIWIQRTVIMLCTAIIGAFLIVVPIAEMIGVTVELIWEPISWLGYIYIPICIVLSVVCFVYQYKTIHMDDFDNDFREQDKLLYT